MASIQSAILSRVIKSVKPIVGAMQLEQQRTGQVILSRVKTLPKGMTIEHAEDCPLNAEWILPENAPQDKVMLYMHGGAYRTGDLTVSRALIAYVCKACGVKALSFEYRLAPEYPFPAGLHDATAAYLWLLEKGYRAQDIAFIGDSAGGGLVISAALALQNKGKPLPACLMCISPWVDLTETSDSYLENDDPMLDTDALLHAALEYSGEESLLNPYISPVFAQYDSSFPPTLIHVGTRESLYDDAVRLEKKLNEGGAQVQLDIFNGMWHVWHVFDIPESNEALQRIRRFIREKLLLPK